MKDDRKILRQLGSNIRRLRMKKAWSQQELGDRAKLHRTYVGSIERSERNVSLMNIHKIAVALGVTVSALL